MSLANFAINPVPATKAVVGLIASRLDRNRNRDNLLSGNVNHRGFTLLELLLVVSIIVITAALAAPSIGRTFANTALRKGADRVRVGMKTARSKAMRTGEVHGLFYVRNGSWFGVGPLTTYQEQSANATRRQQALENGLVGPYEKDLLPRGVEFIAANTSEDSRSAAAMEENNAKGTVEMVLFYPDGTSQNARLVVQGETGAQVAIQLRGLTGDSKAIRVDASRGTR